MRNNGSSAAIFQHDNENATSVQGYEAPGSYRRVFNYTTTMESIIAIINQSKSCMQHTAAKCNGRLRVDRRKRSETDQWIRVDGKHSVRLQNVNVYVWTGPKISVI